MVKERFKVVPSGYLIAIKNGKVALLKRANTGFEDGNYGLIAGHTEEGETPVQGMIREAQEEAGIEIDPNDTKLVHVIYRKGAADTRVDFFFIAQKWTGEITNTEPHKCESIDWFPLGSYPDNTIEYIKQALEQIEIGSFFSEYGWESTSH